MSLAKIVRLDCLPAVRKCWARVVHCHGCWDLLHIGHIWHLKEAREMGDALVVTVTPDRFVSKGPGRPAFGEFQRAEALAALECVDYVAINRWPTAVETIRMLRPDVYCKGPDYQSPDQDPTGGIALEEAAVREVGGCLRITRARKFSSTELLARLEAKP